MTKLVTELVNQLVTGLVNQLVTEQPAIHRSTRVIVIRSLKKQYCRIIQKIPNN